MARKAIFIVAAAVIVVAGAAAGVLLARHPRPAPARDRAAVTTHVRAGGEPAPAKSTVRLLLSRRGQQALTPELRRLQRRTGERLFPAGSRFTPDAGSWRQAGDFANVTGMLREPGAAPVRAEIGLVNEHGRWLVAFAGRP